MIVAMIKGQTVIDGQGTPEIENLPIKNCEARIAGRT